MSASSKTADKITKTKDYTSQEEVSDNEEQQPQKALAPVPQKKRAKPTRRREQSRALDGPRNKPQMNPMDPNAGHAAASNAVNQGGGGGKKSDTLRLHLELNLDIEITLKARIHGDLTLALLN